MSMGTSKLNCVIVHGCPFDPSEEKTKEYAKHWMPWIKNELTSRGIQTDIPLMPRPWHPNYEVFKKKFEKYAVSENTILIGHSCGSAFLVRWLGESKRRVRKLILVAPWKIIEHTDQYRKRFYTYTVDKTIKSRINEIIMFTADNEEQAGKNALKIFHSALGGKIIELPGRGHYTQEDMRTEEFPELLEEVMRTNMQKLKIKNGKGQRVVVLVEEQKPSKGLVLVMHGLSGNKEQPHIAAFAQAFKDEGFTVVRFDTTNTFGESDGKYEDATTTNYYEDLEDVIGWAKTQPWYTEPFYLAGHSLGGISILLYAEKYPHRVKGLAPISTVVSGKLSAEAHGKEYVDSWRKTGWKEEMSITVPDRIKRLKWAYMVDRLKHDALPQANKLTMPVLLIVGEKDTSTPPKHQRILFDALPGKKELHVIKGAPHTFQEKHHFEEIKRIFRKWIEKVESTVESS